MPSTQPGTPVEFSVSGSGEVVLRPASSPSPEAKAAGNGPRTRDDLFIGAHAVVRDAVVRCWPLLTRDAARFRTSFLSLELITP